MVKQYLALGDSYTIGEGVALFHSFPVQLTQGLRLGGVNVSAPEIIAKAGWTTHELYQQLNRTKLLDRYDLVTLLIGVNDQYRGHSFGSFETDFDLLFRKAIGFCNNQEEKLVVFSIPDWGLSPFAMERHTGEISASIDRFNDIVLSYCRQHKVQYIDVTEGMRHFGRAKLEFVNDGLHPEASEYKRWVDLALPDILNMLENA